MRKIRLSDTDYSFFDEELSPLEFAFFSKHKETFCCMVKDQGRDFWTRFTIVFRSYTVHHGIIRDMPCDSTKIQSMLDQAFITIHDQFVDAKVSAARGFILDIALLAQNKDKFPYLDSRSFTKDPFYNKDTRDVFRILFGPPDQKTSYIQVYILSPVYLRFGGSVCRCLMKWIKADNQDPSDDSYWTPPAPIEDSSPDKMGEKSQHRKPLCEKCIEECGTMFVREKFMGNSRGPEFLKLWKYGDPRFFDCNNPLYNNLASPDSDWRECLEIQDYQDFVYYVKTKFGTEEDKCANCLELENAELSIKKKKKKKKKKKNKTQTVVTDIDQLDLSEKSENGGNNFNDAVEKSGNEVVEKEEKWPFSSNAITRQHVGNRIIPGKESHEGCYNLVEIEDKSTGCSETTVTIKCTKCWRGEGFHVCNEIRQMDVFTTVFRAKIPNLPSQLELWKGKCCLVAILNYEEEERSGSQVPTNFNLKVNASNDSITMSVMFQLLRYVGRRKQRTCPGWTMVVDDILTCVLHEENYTHDPLRVSVQKGFHPGHTKNKNINKTLSKGVTNQELVSLLGDISEGIAFDMEDFVVMKDGTMIHLNSGGVPVIDIRGCAEREKKICDGFPIDVNELVADRKAEGPIWDLVTRQKEKYDVTFLPQNDDRPEFPDPFGVLKSLEKCKDKDYAIIGYSSDGLQAGLTPGTDKTHHVGKHSEKQKRSQRRAKKHKVDDEQSVDAAWETGLKPVDVAKETGLKSVDVAKETGLKSVDASKETGLTSVDAAKETGLKFAPVPTKAEMKIMVDFAKKTGLQFVDAARETGLKSVDVAKETGLKSVDAAKETGLKYVDAAKETGLKSVNAPKKTGLKSVNATKETGLKSVNATKETGLKSVDVTKETGLKSVDTAKKTGLKLTVDEEEKEAGLKYVGMRKKTGLEAVNAAREIGLKLTVDAEAKEAGLTYVGMRKKTGLEAVNAAREIGLKLTVDAPKGTGLKVTVNAVSKESGLKSVCTATETGIKSICMTKETDTLTAASNPKEIGLKYAISEIEKQTASPDSEKLVKKKPIKMVGPFNATPRNWALKEAAEKEALKKKLFEKTTEVVAVHHIFITSCSKPDEHGKGCNCCEMKFTTQIDKYNDDSYNVRLLMPNSTEVEKSCPKDGLNSTIRSLLHQKMIEEMPFLGVDRIDVNVKENPNGALKINLNMFGYSKEPPVVCLTTGPSSGFKKKKSRHKNKKQVTHEIHTSSYTMDCGCKVVKNEKNIFTSTSKTTVSDVPFTGQKLQTEDVDVTESTVTDCVSLDRYFVRKESSISDGMAVDKYTVRKEEQIIRTEYSLISDNDAVCADGSSLKHKLLMMENERLLKEAVAANSQCEKTTSPEVTVDFDVSCEMNAKLLRKEKEKLLKEALAAYRNAHSDRSVTPGQGATVVCEGGTKMKPKQLRMEKQKLTKMEKENVMRMALENKFVLHKENREKETLAASKEANSERSVTPSDGTPSRKLRCCSNCHAEEEKLKQFKKCQRCKQELIQNARYYCGKDCQMLDWVRHKQEHLDGSML